MAHSGANSLTERDTTMTNRERENLINSIRRCVEFSKKIRATVKEEFNPETCETRVWIRESDYHTYSKIMDQAEIILNRLESENQPRHIESAVLRPMARIAA